METSNYNMRRPVDDGDWRRICVPRTLWSSKLFKVPESVRAEVGALIDKLPEAIREGRGYFVYGRPGIGKSAIGALLALAARSWRKTAYFTTVADLRDAFHNKAEWDGSYSVLEWAKEVDVLVLDDLQGDEGEQRFYDEFPPRQIAALLRQRSTDCKMTVVTASIRPGEFEKAMKPVADALKRFEGIYVASGDEPKPDPTKDPTAAFAKTDKKKSDDIF